jgi:DNA-binding beta-propeller fold protein YncE
MARKKLLLFAIAVGISLATMWVRNQETLYPYIALVLPLDHEPAATIPELVLEEKIPLGDVKGRIDHMAVDVGRKRILVAELGNNSVGVVDLQNHRLEIRLTGFHVPQGIAYVPGADTVFIANGRDGTVEIRRGADLSVIKTISLGDDTDNIRVDGANRVIIGFGSGGLAVLDATTGQKRDVIGLAAHPESFQIDSETQRIFVNEPNALKIAVIDRRSGKEIASWGATAAAANFPMAFDSTGRRLFVAYRLPALITAFDTQTGKLIGRQPTCGDADDVFQDKSREHVYLICGDGSIAVFDASKSELRELSRIRTRRGTRTGLYVPELDRLFVAVPMHDGEPAQVWVYKPS